MNEEQILNLAKEVNGEVTITYLYAYSDLKLEDIEKTLNILETKNYLKTEIDNKTGVIKYIFSSLMKKEVVSKKNNNFIDKFINKVSNVIHKINKQDLNSKFYSNIKTYDIKIPIIDFEKIFLQIAYIKKGKLHIEDVLEYIPLSIDELEAIFNSLYKKGLCKKEFENNNLIYVFNDILIHKFYENNDFIEKLKNYYFTSFINIPEKIKNIAKNKTFKYISNKNSNRLINFILPGSILLKNKQISKFEYLFFFILPIILTAGISYIPQLFISRYRNLKYYSLSEDIFFNDLKRINKESILYSFIFIIIYFYFVGIEGIINYYNFIFRLFF